MGGFDVTKAFFITFLIVIGVFALLVFAASSVKVNGVVKNEIIKNNLGKIDAAYITKSCFERFNDGKITEDFLDANKNRDVREICKEKGFKLYGFDIRVMVKDLENKNEWSLRYEDGLPSHKSKVYINIWYDNEVHIGVLHVQIPK